jgi:hypothetical protein
MSSNNVLQQRITLEYQDKHKGRIKGRKQPKDTAVLDGIWKK